MSINKRIILYISIGIAAVIVVGSAILFGNGNSTPSPSELLSLGEKYLAELDYEQALVQFMKVIEIEPMNERAYLGASEAYIGLGQTSEAIAILEKGLAALPDSVAIEAMLAELQPPPELELKPEAEANSESEKEEEETGAIELTETQLSVLKPLEDAIHAMDYVAAYAIMNTDSYKSLWAELPEMRQSLQYKTENGGAWKLYLNRRHPGTDSALWFDQITNGNGAATGVEFSINDDAEESLTMCNFSLLNGEVNGEYQYISYRPTTTIANHGNFTNRIGSVSNGFEDGEVFEELGWGDGNIWTFKMVFASGMIVNYDEETISADGEPIYIKNSEEGGSVHTFRVGEAEESYYSERCYRAYKDANE